MTEQVSEQATETQSSEADAQWGLRLAHERRERKLELTQVADELRLEIKLLEFIESENVAALPISSFVKGYLRSYARFLEIDAEPIIAAFDKVADSAAPRIAPTRSAQPIQAATSKDSGPRTVTTLLIAVLVVSFLVWWGGTLLSNGEKIETSTEQNSIELMLEPSPVSTGVSAAAATSVPALAEELIMPVPEADPVSDASDEPTAESVAETEPADSLVLEFNADSWVEISDANGKRVFFDLGKAGQRYQREGQPPFAILFGNAPGVTLYHNGELVDHSGHNRKGVAKFKLGE